MSPEFNTAKTPENYTTLKELQKDTLAEMKRNPFDAQEVTAEFPPDILKLAEDKIADNIRFSKAFPKMLS